MLRPLLAQLRVELILTLRRGENLLVTLVVPVLVLVFFGAVAATPIDFLVPGVLALAIMSTSMVSLGIATAYERYYGVLKRLLGSPLPHLSLLAARTLSTLIVELVQVGLLSTIARLAFGWSPTGSAPLAGLALLLGSIAFAGLGLLMAGTLRAEATLALANGLYLVFLLLGGFIFPLERLPAAVAAIAQALPPGLLSGATRAALSQDAQAAFGPLALLALWALLTMAAAGRTFRAD
ncbi:MAG: ABC transporter permease [Chloroflexota bacterium]|nr:ABC transporter permease [Chloroflexota bacterium]